jgi:hypothetical protein
MMFIVIMCVYTFSILQHNSAPREIEAKAGWHPLLGAYEWFTRVVSALYVICYLLALVLVIAIVSLYCSSVY